MKDGEIILDTEQLGSDLEKRKNYQAEVFVVFSPSIEEGKGIVEGNKIYHAGSYRSETKLPLSRFCVMLDQSVGQSIGFKIPYGVVAFITRDMK